MLFFFFWDRVKKNKADKGMKGSGKKERMHKKKIREDERRGQQQRKDGDVDRKWCLEAKTKVEIKNS